MPKGKRICKICGKEYDYCKTWSGIDKFRYQDVACSPECGARYFAQIEASRNPEVVTKKVTKKHSRKATQFRTQFKEEVAEEANDIKE